MVGRGSTCGLSHVSSDYLHSQAALDFILLQTSCSVKVWGSLMVEEKCFLGKPGNKRKAKLICFLVQASSVLLCQVLQEWEWLRWREEFASIFVGSFCSGGKSWKQRFLPWCQILNLWGEILKLEGRRVRSSISQQVLAGTGMRHPHLGYVHLPTWNWAFFTFIFLAAVWTLLGGVMGYFEQ